MYVAKSLHGQLGVREKGGGRREEARKAAPITSFHSQIYVSQVMLLKASLIRSPKTKGPREKNTAPTRNPVLASARHSDK